MCLCSGWPLTFKVGPVEALRHHGSLRHPPGWILIELVDDFIILVQNLLFVLIFDLAFKSVIFSLCFHIECSEFKWISIIHLVSSSSHMQVCPSKPLGPYVQPLLCSKSPCHFWWFSSVQLLSHVQIFVTPWTAARQASLSITISWSPPKPMSIESVMPSNHLIFCCPLLLLPSIFPSIRVFSNDSVLCIRWPKYWSFSFSISPSNEHPGLISFRMDWLDLLAVQGILKSLLQYHTSKASILLHSDFLVQLSHPYMTTGKTIALTRRTFVDKVMSLLFNMLSRLVITFLPRSKRLLFHGCNHHLQWFWSPEK